MANGKMGQGKGVRPVISGVPGQRPGNLSRVCPCNCSSRLSFTLLQELSKQWVVQLISPASCAYQ
jgi:hypothetical protein